MLVCYKNAFSLEDIIRLRPDGADLIVGNYHNELWFGVTVGIPIALKEARRLTLDNDCAMLMHARMNIEGEKYLSTIFIERGEIAGVADCISKDGVVKGKALRVYGINKVKIGLVVDEDVKFACADNLFAAGASTVFHNTLSYFDKDYYKAYKCHSGLRCGRYFGLFGDCAICLDGGIKILPSEGRVTFDDDSAPSFVARRMYNVTSD